MPKYFSRVVALILAAGLAAATAHASLDSAALGCGRPAISEPAARIGPQMEPNG